MSVRPGLMAGIAGSIGLLLWLSLFAAGMTIDSTPFRDELAQSVGVWPLLATILFYTPLNAALLTILAGLIGGCASYLNYATYRAPVRSPAQSASRFFRTESPVASMLRGFLVYLAAVAGIYITTEDPFGAPTPAQYVRVVGLLSFVGFALGYDPTLVTNLLARVPGLGNEGADEGGGGEG